MKKITLLFVSFLAFNLSNAQDTCATAQVITAGPYTVAAVDGSEIPDPICAANGAGATFGEWYAYTATVDGVANVTTDLPANTGGDTRVHVYEGSCGALTCVGGNDDTNPPNYLSDATFPVSLGTTYYIAFDDRWDAAGFDFELSETAVDCSTASPYSYDFADVNPFTACYTSEDANSDGTAWGYNDGNDFDGDLSNDGVGLIFPQAAGVEKDDWLFLPVFNGIANTEYSITVVYNVFNNPSPAAEESFDIVALDSPSSTAVTQSVLGTYSAITQSGDLANLFQNAYSSTVSYTPTTDGDFYFAIHSTTPALNSGIIILFNLSVSATLSIDEFGAGSFKHFYNKDLDLLTLESSDLPLDNIELFNILGQNVISRRLSQNTEVIDLESFEDGIYLAKITIAGKTQTIKFLKQ